MAAAYSHLKALEQRTEFFATLVPFGTPDSPFGIPPKPQEKPDETNAATDGRPDTTEAAPDTAGGAAKKTDSQTRKMGRRLTLLYAAPNRLRLEMEDPTPGSEKPLRYEWVSDGKRFWTTIPEKNWYTSEKAPKRFADFRSLSNLNTGSLELLMLLGVNPFSKIREQCDRLTWEEAAVVREIPVCVVALRSDSRFVETVAKLYIGQRDFLLRRVTVETTPVVGPATPGRVGDALDDLAEDDPNSAANASALLEAGKAGEGAEPPLLDAPAPPPTAAGSRPMMTRVTYENIITPNPSFPYDTFLFSIPANAWRYGDDNASAKGKRRPQTVLMRRKKRLRRLKQ